MSFVCKYPKRTDKNIYDKSVPLLERNAYYGLPKTICFCRNCIISNQRPSSSIEFRNDGNQSKRPIAFNNLGICDACIVKEEKNKIDWNERELELRELCDKFRSKDGSYDCIVPGSGGKDSFMTAHLLKFKYDMNPLTCTWAPHIYTDWGWRNHQAWINAGFDNLTFTPNGKVHRLITRLATDKLFYPFQPFILGQKNIAPKLAAKFDIKLIFYGEDQAEYGNPKSDTKTSKMSSDFYSTEDVDNIFIGGYSLSELGEFGLSKNDLDVYLPIKNEVFHKKNLQFHYLGYYEKWHPQGAYYYTVENSNFQCAPERSPGSYNTYTGIDDKIDDFHFHTYYIKFGIGRATYDAAQEIRSGDITREEGVALVQKYDGEFPERFAEEIFEYLSINPDEFENSSNLFESPKFDRKYYDLLCDKFRSPHLWNWDDEIGWSLRDQVCDIDQLNQEQTAQNWKGNTSKI